MPKYSRIFRRFLISYIIILIIPSIAGYMSYRTAISVTQTISIENKVTQLQKSQEILERRIAEVESFTRQLALNQDLSLLLSENLVDEKANVYGIWKISRDIKAYSQTNDFLKHFYIYLKNFNVIITPGNAYFRPEHYYLTSHYTNLTLEQWKSSILDKTHRSEMMPLSPFMNNGTQTSVMTFMQSLPLDSFNDSAPATVVTILDEQTINGLLSGLRDPDGGWTYISDAQGHTLSLQGINQQEIEQLSSDKRLDKEGMSQFYQDDLVITIRSDQSGWVYRAGIPRHNLMENANKIKYITWSVTGAALFIGLIVGFMLSYRNSAPINRLLGVMKEQFGKDETLGRNEYDFLQGNISHILTNNKRLETELNRQLPLIRDAFLKRLIAGEFQSKEEIASAAAQADTGLNMSVGFTGILQINGYSGMDSVEILNELNAARLILKQILLESGRRLDVHMTDLGSDRIVTIFTPASQEELEEVRKEDIEQLLTSLADTAFGEYRITITAAMSDPFASILEVSHAYEQARQALEYAVYMNRKGMVWFSETRIESTTYYYPIDVELRLISTIRAGDVEEAERIVQSIMEQNTQNRELSMEMKHQFIGELKGTLLKLLDQKALMESPMFEKMKDRIISIQTQEGTEVISREITEIIVAMCGLISSKKSDIHIKTVKQINDYIGEMYADPDLNLYRIAEKVERPEKYISQLFKEVTGTNLSDHLEKIRMDHAAELLKHNEYNVDEIAIHVGYNSSHSFRRAFKRVMGVSPTTFRQSIKE
ncbi:helix-turn-helix domain-containing protein [Paenibacillus sp. HWE-109]|uniref:helix-turn-helix domain-containing protein n=1 Tax=Paenibacillus sp. HWE-109 TaxID=1306526 RepID=UPI001EDF99CF|nr:helix-turn-helix domain-containing protein [Paenibacillus sp. HWE-109]UKS30869.1 helix-turn-helix domain-containing protein [Paenibacillus sp. HWE-109]